MISLLKPISLHHYREIFSSLVFFTVLTSIGSCTAENRVREFTSQQHLAHFAQSLNVRYQVIDNRADDQCDPTLVNGYCFRAQIAFTSPSDIYADNWALYFSHVNPIQQVVGDEFQIKHINGDLHQLIPGPDFSGLKAGRAHIVNFRANFWHLSKTDIMPNYYLTSGDLTPEVIRSTVPTYDTDTGLEVLPHAGIFTDRDKHLKRTPDDNTQFANSVYLFDNIQTVKLSQSQLATKIVPTPSTVTVKTGSISLDHGIHLAGDIPQDNTIRAALDALKRLNVLERKKGVPIVFKLLTSNAPTHEWYRLDIGNNRITITMSHPTGAAYALRSLASLLFAGTTTIPNITIEDQPRYAFRGMHLDVARNFRDKNYIIKLLEQMARYKLNILHLHLADDEGWRLAIKDLPELTKIGSRRCHDLTEQQCLIPQLGSGPFAKSEAHSYYSQADYIDILQAAQARHIDIIPSLDMPGHSRAAVISMEHRYQTLMARNNSQEANRYRLVDPKDTTRYSSVQHYNDNTLNVCLDSTYRFVTKVVEEVESLHRQAGVPMRRYHIGADETAGAWKDSPACNTLLANKALNLEKAEDFSGYFIETVANMLADKHIIPGGWSDGMSGTQRENMPRIVQSNAWTPLFWNGHNNAHEQANRHWQIIIASPDTTYFDFPYEADANERGYYWASRGLNTQKVFTFMPDNLPANAESFKDREGKPFIADDRNSPLKPGVRFFGLQGNLWTETTRTDEQADYMMFPRIIALAERAWHKAQWELDYQYGGEIYTSTSKLFSNQAKAQRDSEWNIFANTLGQKEFPKLDRYAIHYRIPPPGATIIDGQLHVKTAFPGLVIQYRIDEGQWQEYSTPINVSGSVEVRAASPDKARIGRSITVLR